ncbi:MAG: DUF2142 domain-containing protein [Clostridia bacterium]|nr:DUF2142 domain-containing protein [Clostridia bacterium]
MKKRITFSLMFAIITFIALFAMLCPRLKYNVYTPAGNAVFKTSAANGNVLTIGTVNPDGNITLDNYNPCVVQYDIPNGDTAKTLFVDFASSDTSCSSLTIESSADGSFVDKPAINVNIIRGEKYAYANLDSDTSSVRIWFTSDCIAESVSFFNTKPTLTEKVYPIPTWRYIVTAALAVLIFFLFFFADTYFNLSNKFTEHIKLNKSRLTRLVLGVLTVVSIAAVLEFILRLIIGPDSAGQKFSMASFGIFALVLTAVFIFVFERKTIALNPERAVAFIIVAVGMFIIFTEPFSHNSSDEDSHYYWAVNNSFVGEALLSEADYNVKMTKKFFLEDSNSISASLETVDSMNALDQHITRVNDVNFSIPHIPAGVFIAVARLFGADFRTKFIFGQMPMLLLYAVLCYCSIKKLKNGKMILSVIALFPTSILLACNFSYDPWVTGFAMLGTVYFINELEQPDRIMRTRDAIIMCGSFLLAAIPKQVYLGLFLLPIFLIKNYKSKKQKITYYLIVTIFFTILFLSFAMRSTASLGGSGDPRGGAVNPGEQLQFILNNPLSYAKSLLKLLLDFFSPLKAHKYVTFFSYLGQGKGTFVFLTVLLFCAATDKTAQNRFKGVHFIKILSILIMGGTVCLIATAMYLSFTPVGYETINGCNPRYLIPLLAPVMLTVFNPGIVKLRQFKGYNISVLLIIVTTLILNVVCIITVPML